MRKNKTSSTTEQPASTKSRGDSVNQVSLVGRLVAASELRTTTSGKSVTTVRIATKGKTSAEFHDVVLWGQLADFACQYLGNGRLATSRIGSKAASGRPLTAALDGPSRWSPTGFKRSP